MREFKLYQNPFLPLPHHTFQVLDFDRKLDRQIADLDDIRIIMETQKKIRDQEIDMDMKIDLVEEAFSLLAKYEIQLTKEEAEKIESLSYNWLQLQGERERLLKRCW